MRTLARIAFRNLNRQKKRSFLLGGAIAFGIMIVTVINGFAGAFQKNVAGNMAQLFAGHVFVEGVEKSAKNKVVTIIHNDADIMAALADAGIDSTYVAKRSAAAATLIFSGKKVTQNIYGTDLAKERFLRDRVQFVAGSWDNMAAPDALILSEGVAKKLKAEVGDRILVQLKTNTGQNNVGEFTLAGISVDMGMFSSMLAYAHRAYLNQLIDIGPDEYQMFGLMIDDLAKAEAIAAKLQTALKARAQVFDVAEAEAAKAAAEAAKLAAEAASLKAESEAVRAEGAAAAGEGQTAAAPAAAAAAPATASGGGLGILQSRYQKLVKLAKDEAWEGTKYRVFTINDMLSQIEEAVNVLNTISLVILIVLFLIIMVGITNTFRMIMYERIKEIGTMRALGMQRPAVRNLFLLEASFLAAGGTIAGWLVAGVVMAGLSLIDFGTGTMLALFLKNGHVAFAVQPAQAFSYFVIVLVLTVVAAFLPARGASRLAPAEALRSSK